MCRQLRHSYLSQLLLFEHSRSNGGVLSIFTFENRKQLCIRFSLFLFILTLYSNTSTLQLLVCPCEVWVHSLILNSSSESRRTRGWVLEWRLLDQFVNIPFKCSLLARHQLDRHVRGHIRAIGQVYSYLLPKLWPHYPFIQAGVPWKKDLTIWVRFDRLHESASRHFVPVLKHNKFVHHDEPN